MRVYAGVEVGAMHGERLDPAGVPEKDLTLPGSWGPRGSELVSVRVYAGVEVGAMHGERLDPAGVLQLLFRSSKQRRRMLRVREILDKVSRIYTRLLTKEQIELAILETKTPLMAKTTDAVLLQVLLNLFDNSIYWLGQVAIKKKRMEIQLDGIKSRMIFSDNGPGVKKEDEPYIFEPFYSGKGEDGRGLGLYIARQLLERNDYSIELAELKAERLLPGANFVVSFVSEEN